ncbi:uncharacterized protein JNUCC1_00210 [Lentibacillus sp. JNUCC-1]|uniref:DUF2188 domain-containing protein n=1 Tax=Lentibacillus sp. JNUCC-1 TaxID=2654513 RepID=UPI0012E8F844|nr:DUF2188 domain-containing protein [Lentibacillus sp. JNUCC-1]MUV36408.1 uncharacterized protein [Lentibacillus sp. JNUCC-1]
MNTYTVVPNVDATAWIVKLEDVAPEKEYESEDKAVAAAEEMAQANSPSMVQILDKYHKVTDEKRF